MVVCTNVLIANVCLCVSMHEHVCERIMKRERGGGDAIRVREVQLEMFTCFSPFQEARSLHIFTIREHSP